MLTMANWGRIGGGRWDEFCRFEIADAYCCLNYVWSVDSQGCPACILVFREQLEKAWAPTEGLAVEWGVACAKSSLIHTCQPSRFWVSKPVKIWTFRLFCAIHVMPETFKEHLRILMLKPHNTGNTFKNFCKNSSHEQPEHCSVLGTGHYPNYPRTGVRGRPGWSLFLTSQGWRACWYGI